MKLSAVLLAGGESRRMGKDKATLLLNDAPLWRRQLDLLRQLNPTEILVSARTDPAWRPADTRFVADEPPSRGPLSGLTAALKTISGTHLLALAVDMPLIRLSELNLLCDLTKNGCGVLPRIGSRAEPLAAIYPRECLPSFSAALESDDHSLQRLTNELIEIRLLRILEVPKSEAEFYRSINIPDDVQMFSDFEQPFPAAR